MIILTKFLPIIKINRKQKLIIFLIFISSIMSNIVLADSLSNRCDRQIYILKNHLIIILKKINVMPTIAPIYKPTRKLYDQAINAKYIGDYKTCIEKTSLAIKYTTGYAK